MPTAGKSTCAGSPRRHLGEGRSGRREAMLDPGKEGGTAFSALGVEGRREGGSIFSAGRSWKSSGAPQCWLWGAPRGRSQRCSSFAPRGRGLTGAKLAQAPPCKGRALQGGKVSNPTRKKLGQAHKSQPLAQPAAIALLGPHLQPVHLLLQRRTVRTGLRQALGLDVASGGRSRPDSSTSL